MTQQASQRGAGGPNSRASRLSKLGPHLKLLVPLMSALHWMVKSQNLSMELFEPMDSVPVIDGPVLMRERDVRLVSDLEIIS